MRDLERVRQLVESKYHEFAKDASEEHEIPHGAVQSDENNHVVLIEIESGLEATPFEVPGTLLSHIQNVFNTMRRSEHFELFTTMSIWFVLNLCLTFFNKAIFSLYKFHYPCFVVMVHMAFLMITMIGLWAYGAIRVNNLLLVQSWPIFKLSVIVSSNLLMALVSTDVASLALFEIMRSGLPVLTMTLELLLYRMMPDRRVFPSVFIIVLACLLKAGDPSDESATMWTFIIMSASIFLTSLKGIYTKAIQNKMSTSNTLFYMTPFVVVTYFVVCYVSGEFRALFLTRLYEQGGKTVAYYHLIDQGVIYPIMLSGIMAVAINWASFRAVALSSAVSMNILGNTKNFVSALLSVRVFGGVYSLNLLVASVLALGGGISYGHVKYIIKRGEQQAMEKDLELELGRIEENIEPKDVIPKTEHGSTSFTERSIAIDV